MTGFEIRNVLDFSAEQITEAIEGGADFPLDTDAGRYIEIPSGEYINIERLPYTGDMSDWEYGVLILDDCDAEEFAAWVAEMQETIAARKNEVAHAEHVLATIEPSEAELAEVQEDAEAVAIELAIRQFNRNPHMTETTVNVEGDLYTVMVTDRDYETGEVTEAEIKR